MHRSKDALPDQASMRNTGALVRSLIALLALMLLPAVVGGCSKDCQWSATTQAFVDDNLNGTWDQTESPLSGVGYHVQDTRGNSRYGGGWKSDHKGNEYIAFFVTCDRRIDFVLSATPPEGYTPTTPVTIDAGSQPGKTFTFGFIRNQ
jgi:hypothetical protein